MWGSATDVWREPVRGGYPDPSVLGLPGLDSLRAAVNGRGPRPPMSHLTGLLIDAAEADHVVFTMPASDWFLSSQEQISAGALTMLADAALGCGVLIRLPPATPYTTAELSVTFLRPCRPGGLLRAVGTSLHDSRPLSLSQAWVYDGHGDPVAHGTSSCYVMPPIPDIVAPEGLPAYHPPEYATPDPFERPAGGAAIPWEEWRTMSGQDLLARQLAGELPQPPIHYLTGMTLCEAGDGAVTFTMPSHAWLTSPLGTVQGGAIAMLGHAALTTAVVSTLEQGSAYQPVDVKVNFLRPVFADGHDLTARGVVTHRGKTLAVATADVVNAGGKKVAIATGSTVILPERPARH